MKLALRALLAGCLLGAALPLLAEPGVPDAPLPVIETGVSMLDQVPGHFAWLDDHTLAITTYGDDKAQFAWTVRKIVAFDVRTKAITTLVPRGFLGCTNPDNGLVSLSMGDLQSVYVGGSNSPPPVQQFQRWDSGARQLQPATPAFQAGWHAQGCLKTEVEDHGPIEWLLGQRPIRYLQPRHGTLQWDPMGREAAAVSMVRGARRTAVAVTSSELGLLIPHLPFSDAYLLRPAVYRSGVTPSMDLPMIVLQANGQVARTAIPDSLKRHLDRLDGLVQAYMVPTRVGGLVVVDGRWAQGGGLYRTQGERATRIWCTAPPTGRAVGWDEPCRIRSRLDISPDGCKAAFDSRYSPNGATPAKGLEGTVKIIDLCQAPKAGER